VRSHETRVGTWRSHPINKWRTTASLYRERAVHMVRLRKSLHNDYNDCNDRGDSLQGDLHVVGKAMVDEDKRMARKMG
jgi:hypothetical protein